MLSRKYLIKKDRFKLINKKGKTRVSRYFKLKYLPNKKDYSQFALVISKKIEKLAFKRNRIKRIFKAQIKNNIENINKGYFYILILKNNAPESELKNDLIQILKNRPAA